MISYAQNFEDVVLSRVLHDRSKGFYVDIGAAHPIESSVTAHFYFKGWEGINIEPDPCYFSMLQQHRRRDTNLNVAIGGTGERRRFFASFQTGLSSLREDVSRATAERGYPLQEIMVETMTLRSVGQLCAGRTVDFLKIDAEGAESEIIASGDWTAFRPHIVIVEAIAPQNAAPSWAEWEALLLEAGYHFVYFDGLNRFYVAHEQAGLRDRFGIPPNVFDDIVPAATLYQRLENERLRRDVAALSTIVRQSIRGAGNTGTAVLRGPSYRVGRRLTFGCGGDALPYQLGGWSIAEPWGQWTDGCQASLILHLQRRPVGPVEFRLLASALRAPPEGGHSVTVAVNGHTVGTMAFQPGTFAERSILLPRGLLPRSGAVVVDLLPTDPISPRDFGRSEDGRCLGIGVKKLSFANHRSPGSSRRLPVGPKAVRS